MVMNTGTLNHALNAIKLILRYMYYDYGRYVSQLIKLHPL